MESMYWLHFAHDIDIRICAGSNRREPKCHMLKASVISAWMVNMNASRKRHWMNWAALFLGAWVFVSPWIIEVPEDAPIAWSNFHLIGAGFIVLAVRAIYLPQAWVQWAIAIFGGWLVVAPWMLGYADHVSQTMHSIAVGAAAVLLAVSGMIVRKT